MHAEISQTGIATAHGETRVVKLKFRKGENLYRRDFPWLGFGERVAGSEWSDLLGATSRRGQARRRLNRQRASSGDVPRRALAAHFPRHHCTDLVWNIDVITLDALQEVRPEFGIVSPLRLAPHQLRVFERMLAQQQRVALK